MIGLPVVSLGGEDLAEIRDVVYNPDAGRLQGFTLNKRARLGGRIDEVLDWHGVVAIGRDAVMVRDPEALTAPEDASDDLASPPTDRNVIGDRVITYGGSEIGEVVDIVVELGEGAAVVGYEVVSARDKGTRLLVPLPEQLAVSGDALVVPAEVEPFARDDLSGFGAAVEDFREKLTRDRDQSTSGRGDGDG
jgi:uncharacterized protein YrrD